MTCVPESSNFTGNCSLLFARAVQSSAPAAEKCFNAATRSGLKGLGSPWKFMPTWIVRPMDGPTTGAKVAGWSQHSWAGANAAVARKARREAGNFMAERLTSRIVRGGHSIRRGSVFAAATQFEHPEQVKQAREN